MGWEAACRAYAFAAASYAEHAGALDLDTELADAVVVAEWGGGLVEQIAERYLLVQFDRETAVLRDPDSEARIITWRWVDAA